MRYSKFALTATVVVACLGSLSSTAWATTKTGQFVNKSQEQLIKTGFTASGGGLQLETSSAVSLICRSSSGSGKVISKTGFTETLTLSGCAFSTGQSCKTAGTPEKIVIEGLEVGPVTAVGAGSDLLLTRLSKTLVFECKEVKEQLRGAFLSTIGSQEKLGTSFGFEARQSASAQEPSKYENSKKETVAATLEMNIGATGFKQTGLATLSTSVFEEQGEFI